MHYIIKNRKFEEGYCVICGVVCNNNCTKVCPVDCVINNTTEQPPVEE